MQAFRRFSNAAVAFQVPQRRLFSSLAPLPHCTFPDNAHATAFNPVLTLRNFAAPDKKKKQKAKDKSEETTKDEEDEEDEEGGPRK